MNLIDAHDEKIRKELCDEADKALNRHPKARKPVKFLYEGEQFYAKCTNFRLLINDSDGNPVCCRYW